MESENMFQTTPQDLLDRNVGKGNPEEQRAGPPVVRQRGQGPTISDHHEHLSNEDGRQNIPHVHHLLLRTVKEQIGPRGSDRMFKEEHKRVTWRI